MNNSSLSCIIQKDNYFCNYCNFSIENFKVIYYEDWILYAHDCKNSLYNFLIHATHEMSPKIINICKRDIGEVFFAERMADFNFCHQRQIYLYSDRATAYLSQTGSYENIKYPGADFLDLSKSLDTKLIDYIFDTAELISFYK